MDYEHNYENLLYIIMHQEPSNNSQTDPLYGLFVFASALFIIHILIAMVMRF